MGLWRSQCDLHTTTIADLSSTQQYTCYFINMWEDRVCMYVVRARSFAQLLCIWYRLCVRVSGVANCNFLNVFFPSLSRSLRHCINLMFLCMSQWFGFMLGRFQYSIMIIKSEFQFITWPKKKWQANMKICSVHSVNSDGSYPDCERCWMTHPLAISIFLENFVIIFIFCSLSNFLFYF